MNLYGLRRIRKSEKGQKASLGALDSVTQESPTPLPALGGGEVSGAEKRVPSSVHPTQPQPVIRPPSSLQGNRP